ncbi:MAG: hypothetical protein JWR42_621 [Marmoricola sp.]|nr:hypothetical protein [Marmoricola sp.]
MSTDTSVVPASTTGARAVWPAVVAAVPGLALGVAGLFHPTHLDEATAHRWWTLHVPAMVLFPMVGVALVLLFRGRRDPVAAVAVLAASTYAVFYNALDVLSGVGAGWVTSRLPAGVPRPDEVRSLFRIGTPMGEIGSWALLLAAVVVAADALRRHGLRGAPGLLLLPGAWWVHTDHIFAPWGALGMALIGLATGMLWWAQLSTLNVQKEVPI